MNAYEFVLALVFMVVVVPAVLGILRSRSGQRPGLSPEQQTSIEELSALAARLDDRVRTLERVLDAEAPGWRSRV
jgi:phage shock protein B